MKVAGARFKTTKKKAWISCGRLLILPKERWMLKVCIGLRGRQSKFIEEKFTEG